MAEARTTTLHYSEALVRRAIRAFWWRLTGWIYFAAFLALLVAFVYLIATGNRSWWLGVLGTVLGINFVVSAAVYAVHWRSAMARFRRMKSKEVVFSMDEDRFRVESELGSTELSWSVVVKVWRFPDFWLLFYSRAQFTIMPLSNLDAPTQAFILERVKAHGAEVT